VVEPADLVQIQFAAQHAIEDHRRHLGQHPAPGGRADLVVDHPQFVALAQQTQHGQQEIRPARAIDPTGAEDQRTGARFEQGALAAELGLAIDVERVGAVVLGIGRSRVPGKTKSVE
jgi:hypothetical protein